MLKGRVASGHVFTLDGDTVFCENEIVQRVLQSRVLNTYHGYYPDNRGMEEILGERIIQDFGGEILQHSDLVTTDDDDDFDDYVMH